MLQRREATLDWMSQQVYRVIPLSPELQRIKDLFPTQCILEKARPFYALEHGRHIGRSDPPDEDHVSVVFV